MSDADPPPKVTLRVGDGVSGFDAAAWDACAGNSNPFVSHAFLSALEDSGSAVARTGWQPLPIAFDEADGTLAGVAPAYAKSHSQGEYVFDHNWADPWQRAGGRYYPKLQIAVPFTPVTGRRFLTRPGFEAEGMAALIQGAVQIGADNNLSSLHITFCNQAEALAGADMGLLPRIGQQFHWLNQGFGCFDDFLASLSSRKRKMLRREREQAQGFGGRIVRLTGDQIQPAHWDAFWTFYQDTGSRKWGSPYLTRKFFHRAQATMRDDMLLILALKDGVPVAGALNFIGCDTLFGRYWGCSEHHPFLHFELCYYQAMEHAIATGLSRVEAGAQGEHKLARGYLPVATHSLHWIADPGFRAAIADYLDRERAAVDHEIEVLTSYGPFKRVVQEEQD